MSEYDLFKKLTTLHLTQEEKRFMRQNVLLHARERGVLSPITSLFIFTRSFVTVTALALMLIVGTTVVQGAETSIPGDVLYSMKRGINERVLGVFAVSNDAKARLETKFVDRRLEEIQKIIVKEDTQDNVDSATLGEEEKELSISSETLAIVVSLTEEARSHAEKAEEHISKVSDDGDADEALVLASELETAIDTHTSTLATLTDDGGEEETLLAIAETVQVLSDSSGSAEALSETIAVVITEDTTIIDEEKAEAKLAQAEKLLSEYKQANPPIDPAVATLMQYEVGEESAPVTPVETQETVDNTAMATSLLLDTLADSFDVTELTTPVSSLDEESTPSEVVEVTVQDEKIPTGVVYMLPTIQEVELQIQACKTFIAEADYANAYIVCTDALQSISTLTQVFEKTTEAALEENIVIEAEVVESIATEETSDTVAEAEPLDGSTLTGKVLDAFDQTRIEKQTR